MEYLTYNMLNPSAFKNPNKDDGTSTAERTDFLSIFFLVMILAGIALIINYSRLKNDEKRTELNR
jgi:hypothetical protein